MVSSVHKSGFNIEFDREVDGRWIAEVTDFPGVLAYGSTPQEALLKVESLAVHVMEEQSSNES